VRVDYHDWQELGENSIYTIVCLTLERKSVEYAVLQKSGRLEIWRMSHVMDGRRALSPNGIFGSFPFGLFRKQSSISPLSRLCVAVCISLYIFSDDTYFVRVAFEYSRTSEATTSPPWLTTLSTRRAPTWPT
jgi:hypothetical protein